MPEQLEHQFREPVAWWQFFHCNCRVVPDRLEQLFDKRSSERLPDAVMLSHGPAVLQGEGQPLLIVRSAGAVSLFL